jgi:hypothetical protein
MHMHNLPAATPAQGYLGTTKIGYQPSDSLLIKLQLQLRLK